MHYSEANPHKEPYRYDEWYREHWREVMDGERYIYESVLPVSRYYIRLRYSLLQLLYDAMFENSITGLPIARSLVITDPLDGSLFSRVKDVKKILSWHLS